MEYNTTRSKMLMPEYGRNVQKMVEYLMGIEDRQKRLQQAEIIIELMGTLNPHLKTIEDYKHKLWDHLFQMTEFKLDVDGPYPCPTPESIFKRPEVLPYPQGPIKHRHLGKNIQGLLNRAMEETNEERKHGLTQAVGYYMKLAYGNWHKEPVHDDMIKNELAEISGGLLKYETGGYRVHFDITPQNNNNNNRNFKQRNNNNNNRNFKGNNQGGQRGNNFNNSNPNAFGNNNNNNNNFNKNRKFKNKNKGQQGQ
ncbi:hypothetical protein GCM10023093_08040 [Nemorincola caseinilytica]|uniref:DUF4290 domain-containing protein n=1 Tax=Nemorincola caseinilytica TaxID=2054315 RepID=A0ABP8N6D4_9BACT